MNKFTKMALVFLYLLQLVVVFREQLAHIYKSAVEGVTALEAPKKDETSNRPGAFRAAMDNIAKISRTGHYESVAGIAFAMTLPEFIMGSEVEPSEDLHQEDDKHADNVRKHRHRKLREYLIANLWHSIRGFWTTTERAELSNEISRVLTFA
jgi:hypothetical protein